MAQPRPAFGSTPQSNPPPEGVGVGRGVESTGRTNSNMSNDENESADDREATALLALPDPALTSYLYDWSRKLFRIPQAGYEPYRWVAYTTTHPMTHPLTYLMTHPLTPSNFN